MKKRRKACGPRRQTKSETLAIRIEKGLLERVRAACRVADRSVGHYVRNALRAALEEAGH